MRTTITLLAILIFATGSFAQSGKLKRGQQYMDNLEYIKAIEFYNRLLEGNAELPEAKTNLAEAYRKVNDTENAEFWYGQVVRLPQVEPIHKLYYGMMLQRNGKCELAREWYQQYVESVPDDQRGQYLSRACDYEDELMQKNAGIFEVKHCDFNSDLDDFSPNYYKGGLVFTSDRERNPIIRNTHTWTGNPFLELYYLDMRETGGEEEACGNYIFGRPEKFSNEVNTKYHDASVSFSQDGKEIFFTRNNFIDGKKAEDDEGIIKLKIFYATSEGEGTWSDMQSLPFNSDEYNVAHPALTPDGKKLFFSSDMPGGFGGMDLYVSEEEGGRWGPPLNLGPEVNTEGHEVFPNIATDERIYFASDGHIGLGGLDVYFVEDKGDGVYSSPNNLGFPINTIADDFGIIFNENATCGFLSSDRAGGVGGDDIFSFKKTATPVEILVIDAKTGQGIPNAKVFLECKDETLTTDSEGKLVIDMKLNECCNFTASMDEYEDNSKEGCTNDIKTGDKLIVEIPLMRIAELSLEGIVFDDGVGLPLEGAVVTLTLENECGMELPPFLITDISGRYFFKLEKGCCYKVKAEAEGYLADWADNICTDDLDTTTSIKRNLHLQPITTANNLVDKNGNPISPPDKMEEDVYKEGGKNDGGGNQGDDVINYDPPVNKYTEYDPERGGWIDRETGELADGTYDDDKVYKKGVLEGGWVTAPPIDKEGGDGTSPVAYLLHIYYDFDQAYIRDDAEPELQKLHETMIENPDYILEIASHTDARGSNRYNVRLSQRRAESVVRWLVDRGIGIDRLVPRGYGETQNVNDCSNNIPCSEQEHQMNRRTEFRVIGCISCISPQDRKISKPVDENSIKVGGCTNCPF